MKEENTGRRKALRQLVMTKADSRTPSLSQWPRMSGDNMMYTEEPQGAQELVERLFN